MLLAIWLWTCDGLSITRRINFGSGSTPIFGSLTHNPWVVLQTVSRERLQSVTADPNFQKLLVDLQREKAAVAEGGHVVSKSTPELRYLRGGLFLDGVYAE